MKKVVLRKGKRRDKIGKYLFFALESLDTRNKFGEFALAIELNLFKSRYFLCQLVMNAERDCKSKKVVVNLSRNRRVFPPTMGNEFLGYHVGLNHSSHVPAR